MARKQKAAGVEAPAVQKAPGGMDFLGASTRASLRLFRRQLRRCRRRLDADSVHDLRVAARRFMVWCDLLAWLQAEASVTVARRRVKRLLRALAALRDLQVQLELLQAMPRAAMAGVRVCRRWYLREMDVEMKRVDRCCRRLAARKIADGLRDGLKSLGPQRNRRPRSDRLDTDAEIRRWVRSLAARAGRTHRRVNAADPDSLHRLRIALKHLRYALEALAELPMASTKTGLLSLRARLDLLGEIQDADVFQRRLGVAVKVHPRHAGALRVLVRWLLRRREARIRRFLHFAKDGEQLLEEWQSKGVRPR